RPTSAPSRATSSGCSARLQDRPQDDSKSRHENITCRHYGLTGVHSATHNAGIVRTHADKSRHQPRSAGPIEELLGAKLGAFFRAGKVERIGRGLYRLADAEPTEHYSLAMACARVPRSIVCLLSALRVHGIGTQAPAEIWLAIPHKARIPRLPELRLRIVRFSGPAWTFGVKEVDFEGVPARITSPARTIVDCFRFERLVGPEAAMEALQDVLR